MRLAPRPVQQRAVPTVVAAIDAAIALIEERGQDTLRLADVSERSGVSNGSLMHHFGSREGLLAAALATRFDRAMVARIASFADLGAPSETSALAIARLIVGVGSTHRGEARRARVRALSYARHRPDVREVLAASIRASEQAIERRAATGAMEGVVVPGVEPTHLAVFGETSALALLLEDRLLVPLPSSEWQRLFSTIIGAVLEPAFVVRLLVALEGPLRDEQVRLEVAPDVTSGAWDDAAPAPVPTLQLSSDEQRIVDHVELLVRAEGPDAVVVSEVCAVTGVSRGWFSRRFGVREDLLDLARLQGVIRRAEVEVTAYEEAFASAHDGPTLGAALDAVVARSTAPEFLEGAWDRLDVVVAAETSGSFARDAGVVIARALERIASGIAAAQQRGAVRGDVSARALARFLWGYPLAFLVGEIAGVRTEDLRELAGRVNRTLAA